MGFDAVTRSRLEGMSDEELDEMAAEFADRYIATQKLSKGAAKRERTGLIEMFRESTRKLLEKQPADLCNLFANPDANEVFDDLTLWTKNSDAYGYLDELVFGVVIDFADEGNESDIGDSECLSVWAAAVLMDAAFNETRVLRATEAFNQSVFNLNHAMEKKKLFGGKPKYSVTALCQRAVNAIDICISDKTGFAGEYSDAEGLRRWRDEMLLLRLSLVGHIEGGQ